MNNKQQNTRPLDWYHRWFNVTNYEDQQEKILAINTTRDLEKYFRDSGLSRNLSQLLIKQLKIILRRS